MNFNSILIGSEDPQRLVDYYTKLFGEPGMSDGGYTGWKLGDGSINVGPHSEVQGKNAHPGRIIMSLAVAPGLRGIVTTTRSTGRRRT